MRADTAWDVAESAASCCSAHNTVGVRADAAATDVSRKKWRRDGAELITFFIVQPCDGVVATPIIGHSQRSQRGCLKHAAAVLSVTSTRAEGEPGALLQTL